MLLEADLAAPEPRDPRAVLIRRQAGSRSSRTPCPRTGGRAWPSASFRPTRYRLLGQGRRTELARATTWDMTWFGRGDGRSRIGLIDVEVAPTHRRKGYGRHLVGEILR